MNEITMPGIMMGSLAVVSTAIALTGLQKALKKTQWTTTFQKRIMLITATAAVLWMVLTAIIARAGFFTQSLFFLVPALFFAAAFFAGAVFLAASFFTPFAMAVFVVRYNEYAQPALFKNGIIYNIRD